MLHLDIPSTARLLDLARHRGDLCATIYLPTTPISIEIEASRIELKNLIKTVLEQFQAASADKRALAELADSLDDLLADGEFWRFQARSLAIFATPDNLSTFRLPTTLEPSAHAADRFHLKPLLRAVSFPNTCYVLALSEGGTRLVEVAADLPASVVKVPNMPESAATLAGRASINDRSHFGRLVGSEGKNVRLRQYARAVDNAVRDLLTGSEVPLVLAAVDRLGAMYRSVNSYTHLLAEGIQTSPERLTEAQLAEAARPILDRLYAAQIDAWRTLYATREREGRGTTDIAKAAKAATMGAVQSLLVDMDRAIDGTVDEATGEVRIASGPGARTYGVIDEIARRVLLAGGEVRAARAADLPGGAALAAVLRYAI